MKTTVHWSISVSSETDRRVRRILDASGRKGDLSRFVEEAVKSRLLELRMQSLPTQVHPSANDVEAEIRDTDANTDKQQYGG